MIAFLGESLIDFIPRQDGTGFPPYQGFPGGSPFNSARSAARLGAAVQFIGKVSTDFFGARILEQLRSDSVGTDYVVSSHKNTTLAFVSKNAAGDAAYSFYTDNTADRSLEYSELPVPPEEIRAVMVGSISLIHEPAAEAITMFAEHYSQQRVISFDPNIRPSLIKDAAAYRKRLDRVFGAASIVKISDEDFQWVFNTDDYDKTAANLLDGGSDLVLITLGKNGSRAYTRSHTVSTPGRKVEVADTIGAGDSFHGAVLTLLDSQDMLYREKIRTLSEDQLRTLQEFAGSVAAVTCSRYGADPAWAREVIFPRL